MEETIDDAPTSAVVLDHCHFAQVIFNSVEKFYVPGGDITCHYTFTHFVPRRKDWIGIFRVEWNTTREYYTFMWVTLPVDMNSESAKQQEVQFKAYYLPKDDEYYQFCYVDQDGVVRGASIPFQFHPENEDHILVVSTQGELETLKNINKELERNVKEQRDCWETEFLLLKEKKQMMSSENEKMGIRIDQLQTQLLTQEKAMEKLILGDQDKTEQLERLKKENDQLLLSLTDQKKHQKKLEQTVKEMKQKEASATRKQQELMDQNFDLSKRLSENEFICKTLQKEKEKIEGENDLLKKENRRLLSYMGLDFDSLPYQVPASAHGDARQNPGLVYGNPYCRIQESSFPNLATVTKYSTGNMGLAEDMNKEDHSLEQRVQALCLDCPICDKSFPIGQKQIFEDHVLCHAI
ncbi:PREDICTED: calcium-binding and coiled-coil domain-containing protein 2-like isoform X2 [Elephantulus edwardii]|uniref:calcium-binding and coiled-coil domain-containing protein 2-like isoform X2 n=1 Tax=Elephantulus edwardii TaxID=28737 RepID=UPI0003F0D822|nr:PREDICTED: calcium-binding and coiled-coil domain-containing protein 2-like isoform X2 [Elephantulus edwardii]